MMDAKLREIYKKLPLPNEFRIFCSNCNFQAVTYAPASPGEPVYYTGLPGEVIWPMCPTCRRPESLAIAPVFGPVERKNDPYWRAAQALWDIQNESKEK